MLNSRCLFITMAGALLLGVPAASASSWEVRLTSRIIDAPDIPQCKELVPEAYDVVGVTDDGQLVSLDVYVLLDFEEGAAVEQKRRLAEATNDDALAAEAEQDFAALVDRARELLAKSPTSYEPLEITLNFTEWGLLAPLDANGNPRDRTLDSQSIINLSKAQFGGARPDGVDVVYTLTDLDMTAPDVGSAVAGHADCIGGVRYPGKAFAVGEIARFEDLRAGPITFYHAATAKIASHEIGHLMGAHHHYQDCVEGITTELDEGEASPCTLMSNFVDFQSLNFSVVEGAVVRGHAIDFAAAND